MLTPTKDGKSADQDWVVHQHLLDGVRLKLLANVCDDRGTLCEIFRCDWKISDDPVVHVLEMLLRGDNRIPSSNIVHRLSVITDVGGWDGRIARNGDIEYWQRMLRSGRAFSYVPAPTTLSFTASLRPKAYRDRETHEQQAYYEQIAGDPRWVARLRDRLAEDLERRFMDQEVELAARLAVINELDAAVRAWRAAGTAGVATPGSGFGRLLGRLIRRG